MQKSNQSAQVLVYPNKYHELRMQFLKVKTAEQFKNISEQTIQKQYKILDSADVKTPEETLYIQKTNKNRYIDILVYHHNRIKCKHSKNFYLNASMMKSIVDQKDFAIFGQAPTPQAFQQFWQAIYQNDVKTIVMLCSFHDPRRGRQSQQYWPDQNQQLLIKEFQLKIKMKSQQKVDVDYVITTFQIIGNQGTKIVRHLHWTGWSDLKKPLGEDNENKFREIVKECLNLIKENKLFMIHCSAGIGRTGTLGTVIQAIRCMQKNKKVSIFAIVQNLRQYRMHCVQTFQQYKFIYQQLQKYF